MADQRIRILTPEQADDTYLAKDGQLAGAQLAQVQTELLDGLTIQVVTQAEYNALPTPRPINTLYIIS